MVLGRVRCHLLGWGSQDPNPKVVRTRSYTHGLRLSFPRGEEKVAVFKLKSTPDNVRRVAHVREPDPCLVGGKEKTYYALNETWQRPTCFVCLGFDYDPQNPTNPGGVVNREGAINNFDREQRSAANSCTGNPDIFSANLTKSQIFLFAILTGVGAQ